MTYEEVLGYLYRQLPMFHRIGAAAYKADLKNTQALCDILDHPENKFRSIHVAGTNGKGSTSHMLAAVLQMAGYKTGLYTSPHLKDFRERIRINGEMIGKKEVVDFVELHREKFEKISLSFFEWTVGLCFDYFARERVEIAVVETGLGGRLDSTNVISPLLSVITNVSLDHTNLLGKTVELIAAEKAGIIKPGIPVVVGETDPQTSPVFQRTAVEKKSSLVFADQVWHLQTQPGENGVVVHAHRQGGLKYVAIHCDLKGEYQKHNLATVFESIEALRSSGFSISDDHVYAGLSKVSALTGLQGRWQKIVDKPLIICDVAHNEAGIRELVRQIRLTPHARLHMVFGAMKDKDVDSILRLLPAEAVYYFCKPDLERAMDEKELMQHAEKYKLSGRYFSSVSEAMKSAKQNADDDDLIVVGGSTFVVSEVI